MSQKAPTTSSMMALHSDSHKQSILSKFNKLRKKDLLCDITLVVEDVHFKAHRALLAASSDYFSLMFTADGAKGPLYQLQGMEPRMFAALLEFIYSAQVSVEPSAIEQLLAIARLMEVHELVKVLAELTSSSASRGEEIMAGPAGAQQLSKRKRGRPRKNVPMELTVEEERTAQSERHKEIQAGEKDSDGELANFHNKGDADYNPAACRQSKRRIRAPLKYKRFKAGGDTTAAGKDAGKRGRKRKYPAKEARCEDCDKVFKNHLFLKIHLRTHTGEKPFCCQVCGKAFTQKHTLLAHQRIHTGEKPFVCSVCSKALSSKHTLQEHMNLHEEKKSFKCEKCGKTFTQKRQLKSHYRVHTGKSLPECAQCHHKFMDTAQLKKHLRTHTGEKPFTCEICGKCFTTKSTLQTHIRIHKGEKPYTCNLCQKSFSDPSARRRHVMSHSGKKPFTCSFCSLSFTRLDNRIGDVSSAFSTRILFGSSCFRYLLTELPQLSVCPLPSIAVQTDAWIPEHFVESLLHTWRTLPFKRGHLFADQLPGTAAVCGHFNTFHTASTSSEVTFMWSLAFALPAGIIYGASMLSFLLMAC